MAQKTQTTPVLAFNPQLDGMRFCAVFVVLFYHFMPMFRSIGNVLNIGVLLAFFFVLSSYLITKILLVSRQRGAEAGYTPGKIGVGFLIRRTLRIFPPYYFYLFLIMMLPVNGEHLRRDALVFFTYVSNFKMYADQGWGMLTAHLWTLAVEEQFYLVWPWLVLLLPLKHLNKLFYAAIICGIVSRIIFFNGVDDPDAQKVTLNVLTPTCLDGFGFGAWLAWQHVQGKSCNGLLRKVLMAALPLWVVALISHWLLMVYAIDRAVVSLMAMMLFEGANKGFKGILGKFLENKVVLYLGKISYGIYLYHVLGAFLFWEVMDRVYAQFYNRWHIDISPVTSFLAVPVVSFISYFMMSVLLATLSWYLLEQPVNRLRRRFTYGGSKKKARVIQMAEPFAQPAHLAESK